jgi:acetyltransferase EpsM
MKLVVIGAGGHAKVVTDTSQRAGWEVIGFADDNLDARLFGLTHLGKPSHLELPKDIQVIIAIGSNLVRQKLDVGLAGRFDWATIIHPKAMVSSYSKLGEGTVVFAGAVIQADTVIRRHCIVNSSASIDHDCEIADYCHIAPNATLTGGVTLEAGVFIGAGSVVIPNRHIGAWSTLGAGGVAVENLDANGIFVGVPAKHLISS